MHRSQVPVVLVVGSAGDVPAGRTCLNFYKAYAQALEETQISIKLIGLRGQTVKYSIGW
jgi:hypothetical protein